MNKEFQLQGPILFHDDGTFSIEKAQSECHAFEVIGIWKFAPEISENSGSRWYDCRPVTDLFGKAMPTE
jgi:hypothetical protein